MVNIATGKGMEGLGIKSQREQDFLHQSRLALGPTQPSLQRVLGILAFTDHSYLVPRFKKE